MRREMMHRFLIVVTALIGLSGCMHAPQATKEGLYTEAAGTIAAQLTETAAAITPTFTEAPPTETASPAPTQAQIILPTVAPVEAIPQATATEAHVNPYQVEIVGVAPALNQFLPKQTFTLTWQLKNVGTATWSGKYVFAFNNKGIQLANQSSYAINTIVQPGETLTISMPATAPADFGTYQTEWAFSTSEGVKFYYVYYTVIVGETTFITSEPTMTVTPSDLAWMCTDAARSNIQGAGCEEFCTNNKLTINNQGKACYAFGVER